MTAKTKRAKAGDQDTKSQLNIEAEPDKSQERSLADVSLNPVASAMAATRLFNRGTFGDRDTTELFA